MPSVHSLLCQRTFHGIQDNLFPAMHLPIVGVHQAQTALALTFILARHRRTVDVLICTAFCWNSDYSYQRSLCKTSRSPRSLSAGRTTLPISLYTSASSFSLTALIDWDLVLRVLALTYSSTAEAPSTCEMETESECAYMLNPESCIEQRDADACKLICASMGEMFVDDVAIRRTAPIFPPRRDDARVDEHADRLKGSNLRVFRHRMMSWFYGHDPERK